MILIRKAVLIIHGFAGGTYDQEKLANYLEKNYRFDVYSFTLPGHSKRSFKTVKYSDWIVACEEQIETLIDYGYKDIYLIGHSMGGVLACYLAKKYKQVKKLVLAAPSFNYLTANQDSNALERLKSGIHAIKNNDRDEVLTRFFKLPLSSINEFIKLVEQQKDSYLDLKIPTLILQGDKDTLVPLASSVNIYNSLTQNSKELVILNGVTHDIFREVNIDTMKKIEKFLI